MLTAMTEVQGLHPMAAIAAVAVLAATPAWLARVRPSFAPEVLREEALLGLCLNRPRRRDRAWCDRWLAGSGQSDDSTGHARSNDSRTTWTLALVGSAMALGAVYSLWSRR
jgi:hypothetical protein